MASDVSGRGGGKGMKCGLNGVAVASIVEAPLESALVRHNFEREVALPSSQENHAVMIVPRERGTFHEAFPLPSMSCSSQP